jgi:hypothetical protein
VSRAPSNALEQRSVIKPNQPNQTQFQKEIGILAKKKPAAKGKKTETAPAKDTKKKKK